MTITIPLHTTSESNAHQHWRERQRRAKQQRQWTQSYLWAAWVQQGKPPKMPLPLRVALTRIAPRELDSDNLLGACKHVRDGVADFLGIDDRDKRIQWDYAQRKGKVREYAVEISLSPYEGPHP